MPKVFVSTVINAPIERVWRVAGDFNGLPAWMPGMKDSVIEPGKTDKEVGAVRKLSMAGTKDVLRERLEALYRTPVRTVTDTASGAIAFLPG